LAEILQADPEIKINMNRKLAFLLLLITLTIGTKTFAQTEPTLDETVEWIRSKLIAYGDNIKEVQFDKSNFTLTVSYNEYSKTNANDAVTNYISNLNPNSIVWEVFPENGTIRITIPSISSKPGSTLYKFSKYTTPNYTKDADRNYTRILFSMSTFGNEENLQERFTKAMKTLIKLCGGYVGTEKF
jgi:hypothetical protein